MERAEAFLRRHNMYFEQMPFRELKERYKEDMAAGLRGAPSSLPMLPSYVPAGREPIRNERVLVIDAGGSNLRVGCAYFDGDGRCVTEEVRKSAMPGSNGECITAAEMFDRIAAEAAPFAEKCRYAGLSFSYPCESLPDGDGIFLRLCKELRVEGAEGGLLCAPLEAALQKRGVGGKRRWRMINDSIGSLLGGLTVPGRRGYTDYIGLVLGTGVNTCCILPCREVTKAPEACALPGEMFINMESSAFKGVLMGTVDRTLDERSEKPGEHWSEKMVSGAYYATLLRETLFLAAEEGELSPEGAEALRSLTVTSAAVSELCLGQGAIADALAGEDLAFAREVNDALLERGARLEAACITAILESSAPAEGRRALICADGTTIRKNPVLQPKIERYLARYAEEELGIPVEFCYTEDATLLGSAWAGLIGD